MTQWLPKSCHGKKVECETDSTTSAKPQKALFQEIKGVPHISFQTKQRSSRTLTGLKLKTGRGLSQQRLWVWILSNGVNPHEINANSTKFLGAPG